MCHGWGDAQVWLCRISSPSLSIYPSIFTYVDPLKMAYASRTAAPATASGLGSDAGMREAASKRPAAAAGLGDGDRPARSPTAAAPPDQHEAPRLLPLPPPPPTDNNLMKEDSSLRVLVLQAADGSKISGEAEVEDYMHLLQTQVDLMATNNGLDSWEAEAQKTEKSFDVRNAVHKKHTGILVEFNSQTMAYLIFNHYAQHLPFPRIFENSQKNLRRARIKKNFRKWQ